MQKKEKKKLSRREQRDLDIEIGFIERVVERDPHFVEALQILGDDYTQRGKYDDGLKVDERLAQLRPDDPGVLYNLACSYALTKQLEGAAATLIRAIEQGYEGFKWITKDPDLQNLRKHALYKKVRAAIRKRKSGGE